LRIVLHDLPGDRDTIDANLKAVALHGATNYFGVQHLHVEGVKVEQGRAMLAREICVCNPTKKGIYLFAVLCRRFDTASADDGNLACRACTLNHPRRRLSETQVKPLRSGSGVSMRADPDVQRATFLLSKKNRTRCPAAT
jgi:hypothetical protein